MKSLENIKQARKHSRRKTLRGQGHEYWGCPKKARNDE
jgi:hypothetical protein